MAILLCRTCSSRAIRATISSKAASRVQTAPRCAAAKSRGAVRPTTNCTIMIRDKISDAAPPPPQPSRRARQAAAAKSEDEAAPLPRNLSVAVVMGVSGCGKSTIASMLAHRLNWIYADGDWFHPQSNVRKMHAGEPLTDEDRWPWLHGIAAWIDATRRAGNHGIVACSALKRAYRDILVGERRDVRIVYLKGERDLIARRLAARDKHFMPPSLLDSQFATLEEPQLDERPIVVSIAPHPHQIVEEIIKRLGVDASPSPPGITAVR
jgi:gluconokinase